LKFKDVNKTDDRYYLDTAILDNWEMYLPSWYGMRGRNMMVRMIKNAAFLAYLCASDNNTVQDKIDDFTETDETNRRIIDELTKLIGTQYAPNLDLHHMSARDCYFLFMRFFGYFHPRKNIYKNGEI